MVGVSYSIEGTSSLSERFQEKVNMDGANRVTEYIFPASEAREFIRIGK